MKSFKMFGDKWLKKPNKKELYDLVEGQRKEIERQKEIIRQLDIKNLELTTIIKEVREYVSGIVIDETYTKCILEILDKAGKNVKDKR